LLVPIYGIFVAPHILSSFPLLFLGMCLGSGPPYFGKVIGQFISWEKATLLGSRDQLVGGQMPFTRWVGWDCITLTVDTVKDGAGLWAEGTTIGFCSAKNGIARNLGRPQ
jgi:hypothetical protein